MCRELDFPWCSLLASSTQSTARLCGPWAAGDRSRRVTLLTDVFPPLTLSGLQMSQSSVISKPVGRPHTKQNVCPGETGRHVLPTSSLQSPRLGARSKASGGQHGLSSEPREEPPSALQSATLSPLAVGASQSQSHPTLPAARWPGECHTCNQCPCSETVPALNGTGGDKQAHLSIFLPSL